MSQLQPICFREFAAIVAEQIAQGIVGFYPVAVFGSWGISNWGKDGNSDWGIFNDRSIFLFAFSQGILTVLALDGVPERSK